MKRENDINNFIFINKDSMRIAVTHLSLIILSCILPQFKFTPTQEYKDFTSWMISNGAFISSKLVPIETDLSNRYVITKERIEKKEEILFVPNDIIISVLHKSVSPICRSKLGYSDDNDFNCLVLFMLFDMFDHHSFFKPYYNYMPDFVDENNPIIYSKELIEKYKVTELDSEIDLGKQYLKHSFDSIKQFMPKSRTIEEFEKIFLLVGSRNFGRRGSVFHETNSMVPYLDLFNHVNNFNTFYYFNDKRNGYVLFAMRPIEKNEEVTVSYGRINNLHLFNVYGFTLKDNEHKINLHISLLGHKYTLDGNIKVDEIIKIRDRVLERNKLSHDDSLKQLKKVLVLRKLEYNKRSTSNINILNIINEEKETISKYIEIIDNFLSTK